MLFPAQLQQLSKKRIGCEYYHLLQTQEETERAEMLWHDHIAVVELIAELTFSYLQSTLGTVSVTEIANICNK